jgi:cytochrome c oxidase subunit IV
MAVIFGLVFVVFYLGYMIDWSEFLGVIRQGGWAAIGIYIVLTVLIVGLLTAAPECSAVAPVMHH